MNLRGFFRAFRTRKGIVSQPKSALARAALESLHSVGTRGAGSTGGSAMYEIIGEGAENYAKSFDKDK